MIFIATIVVLMAMIHNVKSDEKQIYCARCNDNGIEILKESCKMCLIILKAGRRPLCGCAVSNLTSSDPNETCERHKKHYMGLSYPRAKKIFGKATYTCCNDKNLCNYPKNDPDYYDYYYPQMKKDKIICSDCLWNSNDIWAISSNCKYCYWYHGNNFKCGCLKNDDPKAASLQTCVAWTKSQMFESEKSSGCCDDSHVCNHKAFRFDNKVTGIRVHRF